MRESSFSKNTSMEHPISFLFLLDVDVSTPEQRRDHDKSGIVTVTGIKSSMLIFLVTSATEVGLTIKYSLGTAVVVYYCNWVKKG